MRYSTATALFVAALSAGDAMAGPAHAHLHQRAHEKRAVDYSTIDYSKLDVDWAAAYAKGQAEKSAAAGTATTASVKGAVFAAQATSSPAAVKSSAKASATSSAKPASSSSSSSSAGLLNGIVGASNSLTKFGAKSTEVYALGDSAINNVGKPYGSNVIKVDSVGDYPFTMTFENPQSKDITINIWNKVGSDGRDQSGASDAPKTTTLTFVLGAGKEQVVAVDENSNIGWVEACTKTRSDSGGFDTSFGEATFLTKGSGYDLSAIPNTLGNVYNMSISSKEVTCISDMTQNYWLTATQPIGTSDGSCYIPSSTATLKVVMAGNV